MRSNDSHVYRVLLLLTLLHIINAVHSKATIKDLSTSILDFTLGFSRYHSLSNIVGRRSLVWSPLSLYEAMLMVGEGANENTFAEFERITHLKTKQAYREWSTQFLNDAKRNMNDNRQFNISLNIANRLYADDDFDLDDSQDASSSGKDLAPRAVRFMLPFNIMKFMLLIAIQK